MDVAIQPKTFSIQSYGTLSLRDCYERIVPSLLEPRSDFYALILDQVLVQAGVAAVPSTVSVVQITLQVWMGDKALRLATSANGFFTPVDVACLVASIVLSSPPAAVSDGGCFYTEKSVTSLYWCTYRQKWVVWTTTCLADNNPWYSPPNCRFYGKA